MIENSPTQKKNNPRRKPQRERRCANCWVCMRGTDLCPLADDFNEVKWDQWFKSLQERNKT